MSEESTGRSPDEVRTEIERTREQLAGTAAALAAKADVKTQVNQRVGEVRGQVGQRIEEVRGRARDATPQSASQGAHRVAGAARAKPLQTGVGAALVAGGIAGWMIGRRRED